MSNQPTAVKAGVRRIATIAVWGANKADGIQGHITGKLWRESRGYFRGVDKCMSTLGPWCSATAAQDEGKWQADLKKTAPFEHVHTYSVSQKTTDAAATPGQGNRVA
jgi:hypothetical protein